MVYAITAFHDLGLVNGRELPFTRLNGGLVNPPLSLELKNIALFRTMFFALRY